MQRRPYLRSSSVHKPVQITKSYDHVADIRIEILDIAIHDFIVELTWKEEEKSSKPGVRVVTKAAVEVMQAGLGWSKLLPVSGPDNTIIKFWDHFINFEKRFQVTVTVPIGGAAFQALGLEKQFVVVVKGVFDTKTWTSKIELTEI